MYKGKFDQKSKGSASNVHDIVAQRNAAPKKEPKVAAQAAPAQSNPATPKRPQNPTAQPARQPAKRPSPQNTKQPAVAVEEPRRKGPRLGGVIFYTLYFMFILVFFLGTYIGLQWLQGWLVDFEAAQPTVKAQQVFTQLFTNPDWAALYDASGAKDSAYEGREAYVTYMNNKVSGTPLTYMEASAGLSGDKKYVVRLGNEKLASFTLVDKNAAGETTLENLGDLPDWQLGRVEVFFEREGSYFIEMVNGHTAYVNGIPLTDDHTIQIATTLAEKYLPIGTTGASINTQRVDGLMSVPTVTVNDEKGNPMPVTYDEETRTFTERTEANTMTDAQKETALNAAKAFCKWMIKEGNRADIAKYYDTAYQPYKDIIQTTELWMQKHNGYEFANESVTNFAMYTDSLFSVRVSMDLNVTRTDGTVRTYDYAASLFFHKDKSGNWKVFDRTNVDVSQPVGKVRLTFMQGDTQLTTNFYATDSDEVITPVISPIPEGKVFGGWVRQSQDESGKTVLTVMFRPDETGKVVIPEGNVLEPMVLYAYFEDAPAAN